MDIVYTATTQLQINNQFKKIGQDTKTHAYTLHIYIYTHIHIYSHSDWCKHSSGLLSTLCSAAIM